MPKGVDDLENAKKDEITPTPMTMTKVSSLFSQRLKNKDKDTKFKKFLSMIKNISINIPLVDALFQIPVYVKFM